MINDYLETYDFNLPLSDAFNDPVLSLTRRMLAGAAVSQGLDDAYYSAMELVEAFEQLVADRRACITDGRGAARVQDILAAEGDDYQRRLYYIVSELDVSEALDDLAWLGELTRVRARMFPAIQQTGALMPLLPGCAAGSGGFD